MQKVCKELIDFFEHEEGWDKEEVLSDMIQSTLKKLAHKELLSDVDIPADEVSLCWNDAEFPFSLEYFAYELFNEILKGVCEVIRTA